MNATAAEPPVIDWRGSARSVPGIITTDSRMVAQYVAGWDAIKASWRTRLQVVDDRARSRLQQACQTPTAHPGTSTPVEIAGPLHEHVRALIAVPRPGPVAGIAPAA